MHTTVTTVHGVPQIKGLVFQLYIFHYKTYIMYIIYMKILLKIKFQIKMPINYNIHPSSIALEENKFFYHIP